MIVMVFMLMIASFGCTHYYDPVVYPMKPGMVPDFRSNRDVTIVNVQPSKVELIGANMGHKWMGDKQKWTETATKLLKTELEKRGMIVTEGAQKELRISMPRANLFWGAFQIRCILYLKVETADGYTNEFVGNNASGATLYRACNGAITRAVGAMLNDNRILRYLKK